ncbi:MAG: hypothetical protein KGY76_07440, partial [Candidatus Thermoplasmatota archaeon]|nr:hypothetical protein [Candidatus Thermoplasmatota archaeon]
LSFSSVVDNFSFQVEFDEGDPKNIYAELEVELLGEDTKVEKDLSANIILKKSQCTSCSRREGNYYEAILQIRPTEEDMTDEEKKAVTKIVHKRIDSERREEKDVFITAEEEKHGGIDFYLSDRRVTKNLSYDVADLFGGIVKSSSELAGREDGQNVYRMTYSVRLPPYEEGDFIEHEEKVYRIEKTRSGSGPVMVYDLKENRATTIDRNEMEEAEVYGGKELVEDAVVVSEGEKEIQVLDPESYETKTLLKPEDFLSGKEDVKVVRIGERLYLLPGERE